MTLKFQDTLSKATVSALMSTVLSVTQKRWKTTSRPAAAADYRTWANTFNTPRQSRNTPGLRVSEIKAPLQAELLVQYVTDVTACKRLKSVPEVEKCKKSVKSVKSEKKAQT